MLSRLMPKEPSFATNFLALQACITQSSALLEEYVSSTADPDIFYTKVKVIEQQADDITHTIIGTLNRSFITPFDREDIYALVQSMDDVVDGIEHFFQQLAIYQIDSKRPVVDQFSVVIRQSASELQTLITECFAQRKLTTTATTCILRLHELENSGDRIYEQSLRELFQHEQSAITVMKWESLISTLEQVVDQFQRCSNVIESVMVKFS